MTKAEIEKWANQDEMSALILGIIIGLLGFFGVFGFIPYVVLAA